MIEIKNTVPEFNNRLTSKPEDVVVQDINLTLSPKMHTQKGQDRGYKQANRWDSPRQY